MPDAGQFVPFGEVDEATICPECSATVEISMTQALVELEGEVLVSELGYYCPECRHSWTEDPEARDD